MVEETRSGASSRRVHHDGEADEGPVFGGTGKVVCIRRKAKGWTIGAFFLIVYPAGLMVWFMIGAILNGFEFWLSISAIFYTVLYGVAASIYISRSRRPRCSIDLTRDSIRHYVADELDLTIPFSSSVEVDGLLNMHTRDPTYGQLWGYRFSKGTDIIEFSAGDDWQLWDIQGMLRPILEVVDLHGMRQGEDLREYMRMQAGELPMRDNGGNRGDLPRYHTEVAETPRG